MTVVVLGGTGHFGGRILRRLQKLESETVLAPGRGDLDMHAADFRARLAALNPSVLIHTAGPFQGQDYAVARACIDTGCHYIDLADGREFVTGFATLDSEARDAGVCLISGASTLPGLSSSVIESVREKFTAINTIAMTIAPAHQTPRGLATVRAVLGYCGEGFTSLRDGEWRTVYGWQDMRWRHYPGLGRRLSAACNVPDLELLPEHFAGLQTASFHAALEAPWEHLGLWLMAWLKRLRLVRRWEAYAPQFTALGARLIKFGSDRGGMQIQIRGSGPDGREKCVDWHLLAGRNHGPEIPCTPAIVLVKKLLNGSFASRGAFACWNLFTVDDFMNELAEFDIHQELSA